MILKSLYNLFSENKSLLHSERMLYAETSDDDDAVAEETEEEQKKKKKAKKKTGAAPKLQSVEAKEAANYREGKTLENLENIKKSVEPLENRGKKGKELISDMDAGMAKIGEYRYYGDYLQGTIKEIEATGGWWLVPDDDGADEKLSEFKNNLAQAATALGQKGKAVKIDKAATKAETLTIVKSLMKTARANEAKEEKKLLKKIDSTILHYADDIEKQFKKAAPHKKDQLKKEMGAIRETLDILGGIQGKPKDDRIAALKDRGYNYESLNQPSESIASLLSKTESSAALKEKLAEFKAYLMANGVRSGDVPNLKVSIGKLLDEISANGNDKIKKLVSKAKLKLDVTENSTRELASYIRNQSHILFPDEYQVKMTADELGALKAEVDYADDFHMRKVMLDNLHRYSGLANEATDTVEQASQLTPDSLRSQFAEVRQAKKDKVDSIAGQIKSESSRLITKIEGVKDIVHQQLGEDAEGHIGGLNAAIKSLESWQDIQDRYDSLLLSSNSKKELSEMIDLENGKALPGIDLSAEDYLRIAESMEVPESVRQGAMVTCKDELDKLDKELDFPGEVLESQILTYDKMIDGYVANLKDYVDESSKTRIVWLSLYDFKRIGEKLKEWAERRYNRRSDNVIGDAGSNFFKDLPGPLKTAGNEFDRIREQAELDEVEQYKQSYSNKDAWQIVEVMYRTKNQDEMKACMYLLADLGRVRWDDPGLWRQLMYFSHGGVQFNVDNPDAEAMDPGKLHEKLQKVVGLIWDYDTFQEWQTTNESNYNSKMEGHTDFCHKTAEMPGGSINILKGMLREYKNAKAAGKVPKVDPQKFEKMIHYDIEFGKGSGESKLYFLIQGIACGLLSRDVASRVNSKWINAYPVIDIFGSETETGQKPTMSDIRRWAELDGDLNAPGPSFNDWFHSEVIHKPRVFQRVDKALTQGMGQDHDDATAWFGVMSAKTAETILSQNDSGYRMPVTGYQNATIGMMNYLDVLGENYDHMDEEGETSGHDQLIRFASMFAVFDGILDSRMYRDRTDFFKWTGEQYREPRIVEGYVDDYGRANKKVDDKQYAARTAKGLMDNTKEYLKLLDPEFFEFIFETSATASKADVQDFVKRMKKTHGDHVFGKVDPKDVNELHQKTNEFLMHILETDEGKKNVRRMLDKIKSDHRSVEKDLESKDSSFKRVSDRKKEAAARWREKSGQPADKVLYG